MTGINCPALDHAGSLRPSWRDRFGLPVSGLMRVGLRVPAGHVGDRGNGIRVRPLHERGICVLVDNDADNLYITVTAKAMNPRLRIITPAGQQRYAQAMRNSGADEVIIPEHEGGLMVERSSRNTLSFKNHEPDRPFNIIARLRRPGRTGQSSLRHAGRVGS